jgi:hypothetical protein
MKNRILFISVVAITFVISSFIVFAEGEKSRTISIQNDLAILNSKISQAQKDTKSAFSDLRNRRDTLKKDIKTSLDAYAGLLRQYNSEAAGIRTRLQNEIAQLPSTTGIVQAEKDDISALLAKSATQLSEAIADLLKKYADLDQDKPRPIND